MNDSAASEPSVLVVADGRDVPESLGRNGRRVIPEASAEAGLRKLAAGTVDAAVSAYSLPGIDGLRFLRVVRAEYPDLPFVLYADGSETLAGEAIAAGVTEYVPRSAGERTLVRRVERALDRTDAARATDATGPIEPGSLGPTGSAGSAVVTDAAGTTNMADSTAAAGTPGAGSSRTTMPVTDADASPVRSVSTGGAVAATLRLKERAMDEAPVGITISDGSVSNTPLIYINDAFERITGYAREEVLGRNCRFLQGDRSDPEAITKMRDAIDEGRATSVELVNYRKDGTPFWNAVDIAPIRDESGAVTHYVGFQTDVTDRKRAEREVEHKADGLASERADLERLLDRIEGLVHETTSALVTASSREDARQAVVERIAAATPYTFAWIGETDPTGETVTPTAWAGTNELDEDGPDALADSLLGSGAPISLATDVPEGSALATAIEQRRPAIDADRPLVATAHDAFDVVGSAGVLPIGYRDTLYGVLCVYTEAGNDIDGRELAVLDAVCNALATAIDAFESKRVLTAEDVLELTFEIDDDALWFAAISARVGCALEHAGSVHAADGSLRTFVTIDGASPEQVGEIAANHPEIDACSLVTEREDACLFEVTVADPSLASVLADYGARTCEITAAEGVCRLRAELARDRDARSVASALEDRYGNTELVSYHERERPARTAADFLAGIEDRLTDRQRTALRTAYLGGFFEWPRPVSGDELGDSMDISRSTFHQHLRAAQGKIFDVLFEQ
jgi:PAS domain S-box-containing protein